MRAAYFLEANKVRDSRNANRRQEYVSRENVEQIDQALRSGRRVRVCYVNRRSLEAINSSRYDSGLRWAYARHTVISIHAERYEKETQEEVWTKGHV